MYKFYCNDETAVVQTQKGKVRGYIDKELYIFKGIPYAKAKRFHAPEEMEAWEDVLDATSYGYVCPLLHMDKPNGELLVPHRYWVMNEDCQNLNIWTPGCDGEKRPVIVWLHGGGYEAGSAIEHIAYEGENMSRLGQAVVVSINHRLNILGYFDVSAFGTEYANSGNAGGDDIIAALRWIHENIENFGGNPENVTVIGQSGGGAKITTLLQTPSADGLYSKGINMSGVIGSRLADAEGSGEELALRMMKELGIGKDIKKLETVPYNELAEAYLKVKPEFEAKGKYVGCRPHPNAFYVGTPDKHGFRKETSQLPMMVGTVYGEFNSFTMPEYNKAALSDEEGLALVRKAWGDEATDKLLPLYRQAYPERNPVDMLTLDYIFRKPTQQYIRQRSADNDCTYAYMFNYDMPIHHGRTPWHCADIPYVFHNTELVPVTHEDGVTEKLEEQIFQSVMAFARTGNPNNENIPSWKPSNPETEHTMMFNTNTQPRSNFDVELIEQLVKLVGDNAEEIFRNLKEVIQH